MIQSMCYVITIYNKFYIPHMTIINIILSNSSIYNTLNNITFFIK